MDNGLIFPYRWSDVHAEARDAEHGSCALSPFGVWGVSDSATQTCSR